MKRGFIYCLAFIGAFSVLIFLSKLFLSSAGSTMYGGAPAPSMAISASQVPSGAVAMQAENKPSENGMRGMIIRNANLSLQVDNISSAMEKIIQLADNSGGYVVSSNLSQDGYGAVNNSVAEISIRVPAQGLNNALTALKALATQVVQELISGEDITEQYVNLQSNLKNLTTIKEQLAKIMAGAKKTADVLSVFQELSETQKQIDVIEGKIKYYKESVAYSLISIHLSMNPRIESADQKQWKITEAITSSYHALVEQLRNFTYGLIQFLIYYLPLILLWGLIGLILYWIGKKIWSQF